MKTHLYMVVFLLVISCKDSKNAIISKSSINKGKEVIAKEDNFTHKLKTLSIESLPYEIGNCKVDDLKSLEQSNVIESLLNIKIDSLILLGDDSTDPLFYKMSIEKIHSNTKPYLDKYYSLLLDYVEEDITVMFSHSYIYKRLQYINEKIEVFLVITQIINNKSGYMHNKGIQIDLMTYNTEMHKSIDRKRLITTGIGLEDIGYYECFSVDKNYTINIKSYTSIEGESTEITKKMTINSNGILGEEIINGKITSKENGEIFIEKFSKKI